MGINQQTLWLYWQQVRQYKTSFFLMLGFIPLGVLLIDVALPYFLSLAIGAITAHDSSALQSSLIWAGIAGAFGTLCNFIGFQAITHQEGYVNGKIRTDTFANVLKKDVSFFVNTKIGGLTSKYIDFGRSHITLQDLIAIRTSGFVLSFIVSLVIVGSHSLVVATGMLLLCVMLVFQVRWSRRKREMWRHERKRLNSELNGAVADSLTNSIAIKTFSGELREEAHIGEIAETYRQAHRKDIGFLSSEGSARVAVMVAFQLLIVYLTARYVWDGKLAIGVAIFTLAYLQRFASYLFVLGEMLNGYDQALLEAQPMTEILSIQNRVKDKRHARQLTAKKPDVVFNDVRYHYSDSPTDVIRSLSLTIPYGQKVGLVGYSGAGKTTITQLLLRFDDVSGGSIMIADNDLRDITQSSLRSAISFVPQEPLLFHRTLRENVAYGRPEATEVEIQHAITSAYAKEFIDNLPEGIDTVVGERGVKLSGGQRQRIAIARAILKNAPILVLDEATSALDSESEKLIQASLENLMKGRTSIVIAHRLSTIAKLDRIIVLDQGCIVEDGTHTELIAQKGIYAKLWSHQSGGFIEE